MHTSRPELTGDLGMVASTHWLASAAGMQVLERGGNAFDAAATAGFVLQVVEPHLNGPGGEVPVLLWSEADARTHVVCGQGVAPAAATPERFGGLGLDLVPGTGLLPATVPGAFDGWLTLLERWGSWRVEDVLAPAIAYAAGGFPVLPQIRTTIRTVEAMMAAHWPTSAERWLPGGHAPAAGTRLTNPALAATYERVAGAARAAGSRAAGLAAARTAWYEGFVAEAIDRFCATTSWRDTSGRDHGGLLTGADLARWRASVEEPATFAYGRYTVCKTGPWGQGPVFLQQLALLDALDLGAADHLSADWVHTVTEAGKLAFADREAWYGDPAATDVPLADLLDPAYGRERAGLVGADASRELRPGSPGGRAPRLPHRLGATATSAVDAYAASSGADAGAGEPTVRPDGWVGGDTCHLDVADAYGNLVSATPSGGWLQSSPTIPELGFCLGTRGQMFWLEPGLPASLRPGTRPRTTLSPSLALRDGRPWLAFGTPGGDQQDQWSLHFFLSVVHGGLGLQEAIDAPAFHSAHAPSSFYPRGAEPGSLTVEERLDPEVRDELLRRGHDVAVSGPWSLGRLSAVARDADAIGGLGFLRAAANPRGAQGYAAGR